MIHPQQFEQLIARMEEFMLLSTSLKHYLRPILISLSLSAGAYLLRKHQIQQQLSFIISGSCIEYEDDPHTGKSEYKSFKKRNDFVYTHPGFCSQEPSTTELIVHQDCQLLQIDFDKFQDLAKEFPEAKKLTELIRDHYKQQTQQRLYDLTHKKNKQIYDEFKSEHKDLLYSLCQYKLATYLGMSYPTFARLHNQR